MLYPAELRDPAGAALVATGRLYGFRKAISSSTGMESWVFRAGLGNHILQDRRPTVLRAIVFHHGAPILWAWPTARR